MYLRHRTVCGLAPELSQLGKRVAQWYAPFHRSPFLFLIKSISLSLSQSKLSCSHTLFICEIDEYQNSHDINPNPISPMLVQNRSFPSNHAVLWSTSLQTFAIVARQLSKYQLTKYPNYILYKLWGVPVVSVVVFSNKGNKGNHVFFLNICTNDSLSSPCHLPWALFMNLYLMAPVCIINRALRRLILLVPAGKKRMNQNLIWLWCIIFILASATDPLRTQRFIPPYFKRFKWF